MKKPHLKPAGKKGMAQVKKLGRNYKTGGFSKIAKSAGKEYGSKEAGKRVAGAIFQRMAAKHHKSKPSFNHPEKALKTFLKKK